MISLLILVVGQGRVCGVERSTSLSTEIGFIYTTNLAWRSRCFCLGSAHPVVSRVVGVGTDRSSAVKPLVPFGDRYQDLINPLRTR